MTANPLIACPKCRAWLLDGVFNLLEMAPCPACGVPLRIEVFPALFRPPATGPSAQPVMVEGESSCFFHPQKKAEVPCAGCGRFLCALCDCVLDGGHYCPACLEAGKSKGKIKSLDNHRLRYDTIALALALLPILVFYFTLVTAPMALFVAIRYWNAPRSHVQPGRARFILAIIIALLEIGGWLTFFIYQATRHY
jgi:hypothetical protein